MIQIYHLSKTYRKNFAALNDINLKIARGEFVYLTGPSGAGKSSLLKILYRAETPSRGQILINGRNVTRISGRQTALLRRQLGLVFQDFKLLTRRTVFENVAFPLEVRGMKRYEVGPKVFQALKGVGLEKKLSHYPLELSGGEQQRVAIARALVIDPLILLADEPTGNLDPEVSLEVLNLFRQANARGCTVLLATHDQNLRRHFPSRTLILKDGGVIGDETPPENAAGVNTPPLPFDFSGSEGR